MPHNLRFLLFGLLLCATLQAQNEVTIEEGTKEFSLSVFSGLALSGPSSDLEDQLILSGLDDKTSGASLSSPRSQPTTEEFLITDITAKYFFNEKNGLTWNFALYSHTTATGYENIGNGNSMYISSEIWSISMCYAHRTENKKHQFLMGPAFIWHATKGSGQSESFDKKIGLHIGYNYLLVREKNWFLGLKMNYRMAPKSAIGPFNSEHQTNENEQDPITHTSTFPRTEVTISSLNIGGIVGLKLNWNKK